MFTQTFRRAVPAHARFLSTSRVARKTVTESAKETVDSVNKSVGQTLASAIESGEDATQKVKEAVGIGADVAEKKGGETVELGKQKGAETMEQGKMKANELKAGAKEAKDDISKRM